MHASELSVLLRRALSCGLLLAFLLRLCLLRVAVLRDGARGVDRGVRHAPDPAVLLRLGVELLPVLDALQPIRWSATNTKANTNPPRSGASRQCTRERGGEEGRSDKGGDDEGEETGLRLR